MGDELTSEDEAEVESILRAMWFIRNRLDGIALDVIDWMPDRDNEQHHNAVEHLRRAWEVAGDVADRCARLLGTEPDDWREPGLSYSPLRQQGGS